MPNHDLPQTNRTPSSQKPREGAGTSAHADATPGSAGRPWSERSDYEPDQGRATQASMLADMEMLSDARDDAEPYHPGREQTGGGGLQQRQRAGELRERAGDMVHAGGDYARHAGSTALDFVRANALPLALIGGALGFWAWSRSRSRQRAAFEYSRYESGDTQYGQGRRARPWQEPAARGERPLSAGATTTGSKLMGVRVRDGGYEEPAGG